MRAIAAAVDRLLEWPVAPSFTRAGYAVRRRLEGWAPPDGDALTGRVVLITGATSGIGRAAAERLARCGATVIVLGRDEERTRGACAALAAQTGNAAIEAVIADMSDLRGVRAAAAEVTARHERLDVLIHNAGALSAERRVAPDGTEMTVAAQVVGPFLLTGLLLPLLVAAAPSRVLTVSSGGMYAVPLDVAGLEMPPGEYRGAAQYARAKRAQVTMSEILAERLRDSGVHVHALHPGWVDTPGVAASLPRFRRIVGRLLRTPAEGADTLAWLAADPRATRSTGEFWHDRRPRPVHRIRRTRRADTPAERSALWRLCCERSGLRDGDWPGHAPEDWPR